MKQTIALQTPGRSDLDQSSLFSFDQFTAARPTAPVIHRDARFLLVRSGSGVIRLQGREYPLSAGSLAAILPWQISEIVRVDEPLACSVIAYHYDTVARAAHLFRGEDGQPMPVARLMETVPVLQLSPRQRAEAGRISGDLSRELGLASLQEEGQLFSSLNAVSLLVQLTVLFARQALAADRPADAQGPDHRELLRYMYLHCGQKLTLQQLADVFGCSRSTVSARITAMTGLSFFDLLNEMRIGKTADYLLYTDLTLKELAEILGYVDESHISKVFAARLGTRIGQYRATYQKVQNICQIEESRLGYSLVQHICRHYREDLSAAGVARAFGISVQQLNRTLLCQVELNFEDFLALIRVNRACKLLTTTRMTVLDIALEVGYRNAKTLNRNFLKYRLMTPSAYRAANSGQRQNDN